MFLQHFSQKGSSFVCASLLGLLGGLGQSKLKSLYYTPMLFTFIIVVVVFITVTSIQYLLVGPWSFTRVISFNPRNLGGRYYCCCFLGGKTETQRV